MHILIVRFSSMGDVVLQTATINWLKSLNTLNIKISFATSKEFASLLNSHPGVDKVFSYDRKGKQSFNSFIKLIKVSQKNEPINLILDMHATLRSFRLRCHFWTIPSLVVDKRRLERFFMTKTKSVFLKKIFKLPAFGMEAQVIRILKDIQFIFGDSRAIRRTQDFRNGPHKELTSLFPPPAYLMETPYIVLAPSASFLYKRWPVDYFVKLAQQLLETTSYHLAILAGPEDKFCEAFNFIDSPRLHNLQGKTNLSESMSVLSKAQLCIGNDSGMNHIAEAYGVPCVTIFGPTDPGFGFAPHGEKSIFLSKELWCKPCSTTGKSPCYRKRHYCMEMISVDEVRKSALKILGTV